MATSIQLAHNLSAALGFPVPTVMHILGGLRTAGLIVSHGRGPSATAMSNADASALLIGIGSGAAAAHVGPITRNLMAMPLRHALRPAVAGFEKVGKHEHRFYRLVQPHAFVEALNLLLDTESEEPERDEEDRRVAVGPFDWLDRLTLMIGTDARRSSGFAVIRSSSASGDIANIYSTREILRPSGPPDIDVVQLFGAEVGSWFAMHVSGRVLRAAIGSLREPVKGARPRPERIAGFSRRAARK
jgi:hypothetical protein